MSATQPLESRGLISRPRADEMFPVGKVGRQLEPVLNYGTYGVTFFFVLSGFVLTWSSRQTTGAPTFYRRRFARIWPSHFVTLLLAIPIFYSFRPDPSHWWEKPVSVWILLLSIPLLQAWWNSPTILFSGNPAAWTLTCEFFFYAVTPWVLKPFRRLSAAGALAVAAAIFILEVAYRETRIQMPRVLAYPYPPAPHPTPGLPDRDVLGGGVATRLDLPSATGVHLPRHRRCNTAARRDRLPW